MGDLNLTAESLKFCEQSDDLLKRSDLKGFVHKLVLWRMSRFSVNKRESAGILIIFE